MISFMPAWLHKCQPQRTRKTFYRMMATKGELNRGKNSEVFGKVLFYYSHAGKQQFSSEHLESSNYFAISCRKVKSISHSLV